MATITADLARDLLSKALKIRKLAIKKNWLGNPKKVVISKLERKISDLGVSTSVKEGIVEILLLANPKLKIRKDVCCTESASGDVTYHAGLVVELG
jgi:hypothetical protein